MSTGTLTLAERIEAVLVAAGFTKHPAASEYDAAFVIAHGVGATVSLSWLGASDRERADMLTRYENALLRAGLAVAHRDNHLYVFEPPGDGASTGPVTVKQGDVIRIVPDAGQARLMTVSHVERDLITLTCNCPQGMKYHAINCPTYPGEPR